MRLSTDVARDEARAVATIAAATASGITVFDTARAYGHGPDDMGHNERLLARALRSCGAPAAARIVTKGGMTRTGGAWIPDGRARAISSDCEASLAALDGFAIDLYLIHAPDPRTPWRTTVRALASLVERGLVRRVGLSNVNRDQLDEALDLAPIAAVQVPLSYLDDGAIRGGILERCTEAGIVLIAHSPLGGPRRARRLERDSALAEAAGGLRATAAEVALAWLLELSPVVVAIPGATRPETVRSAARAAQLVLDPGVRSRLPQAFTRPAPARVKTSPAAGAEVVLVMGIPGAGKSTVAQSYAGRGYLRLNRDERGGSLRALADALARHLAAGTRGLVLDNTYLTCASRSHVIEAAGRHGLPARCVWLDTPLAQAQVNIVERIIDRFGALPEPEELRAAARTEPGLLLPASQMRTLRGLEPPSADEGFAAVERVAFVREPPRVPGRPGVFVAAAAMNGPGWQAAVRTAASDAPHLVFDWRPEATAAVLTEAVDRLRGMVAGDVASAVCPHAAGPPSCWCRPPLPGLPLAFARNHQVDLARSILIGTSPAHRTLAGTLGATYIGL